MTYQRVTDQRVTYQRVTYQRLTYEQARRVPARFEGSSRAFEELATDLVISVLNFLPTAQRHSFAAEPLSKKHQRNVRDNKHVWLALCVLAPWHLRTDE